ncbi:MAG: DUF202 domain-containing protein [Actinoallomurus sp.]
MTAEPKAAPDPGLAEERTELAWRRTAIAFTALSGTLVKMDPAIGIPALALSTLAWHLGRPAGTRRPLLATVAVIAVSLLTLTAVLVNG